LGSHVALEACEVASCVEYTKPYDDADGYGTCAFSRKRGQKKKTRACLGEAWELRILQNQQRAYLCLDLRRSTQTSFAAMQQD